MRRDEATERSCNIVRIESERWMEGGKRQNRSGQAIVLQILLSKDIPQTCS